MGTQEHCGNGELWRKAVYALYVKQERTIPEEPLPHM
jgi:hypothetical protein